MSLNVLLINPSQSDATWLGKLSPGSGSRELANNLIDELGALNGGVQSGSLVYSHGGTAASGTCTLSYGDIANSDTISIGAIDLTCVTGTPSGESQFKKETDGTVTATNLKNCINAHSKLSKYLLASSALGVVTITSLQRGEIGKLVGLATSNATGFVMSDTGLGTGGTAETRYTANFGV